MKGDYKPTLNKDASMRTLKLHRAPMKHFTEEQRSVLQKLWNVNANKGPRLSRFFRDKLPRKFKSPSKIRDEKSFEVREKVRGLFLAPNGG